MNNELFEALSILEKEKNISKDTLLEAIETSLITACKNHFGKSDNIRVDMNPQTCEYHVFQGKTVVEEVEDPVMEISLANAKMVNSRYELGDTVNIEIKSKEFGRIATQNAKNVILQKIREEERKILCEEYYSKEKDIVTGIVQRYVGRNVSINLGKVDAMLTENEQVRGEVFQPTERIKLYILEVKSTSKGPKILVSRTHPELVRRLFESEVAEVKSGIVEIKSIAREAGSRTKIAVHSNDPNVDAVGACVGMNGARVNAIVNELRGEKIDIITWNDNPAMLIENALSPAKVISVIADAEEKSAKVVVPDYQLSLAIGKEGQNARLAARLTGFKIDIKSETQAREAGDFFDYENDYEDADEYDESAEDGGYTDELYEDDGEYAESYDDDGEYAESYDDGDAEEPYEDGSGYAQRPYDEDSSEYAEQPYDEDGGDAEELYEDGGADTEELDESSSGDAKEPYEDSSEYAEESCDSGEADTEEPYEDSSEYAEESYDSGEADAEEPYEDSSEYAEESYDSGEADTEEPYEDSSEYAEESYDGGEADTEESDSSGYAEESYDSGEADTEESDSSGYAEESYGRDDADIEGSDSVNAEESDAEPDSHDEYQQNPDDGSYGAEDTDAEYKEGADE